MALSTTEVEYIGITKVEKEALWLKDLALEMDFTQDTIRVHYDSQSALLLAHNFIYYARIKHIDIRYH